ncbi:MAG: hypothetical protein M3Q19_05670 [Pseudomonadota bacterium]|nr:hypothetical protein [Pseudomonadota bacterium]
MIPDKTTRAIDHANAIFSRLDERDGAVREAARRERQRLNSGFVRAVGRSGVAIGIISLATIAYGVLIGPIGLFGFLAAVGLAIGVAALLLVTGTQQIAAPNVTPDLPNGQMVQRFDSYLFRARRALPAPAQAELDSLSSQLPSLRQVLERIPDLDPNAQDARRLMSVHLPNLIDRYLHVPQSYRGQLDGEGVSVDQRLVEALAAGRVALKDISEKLARNDLAAFETQGRFIQSRYKDPDALR